MPLLYAEGRRVFLQRQEIMHVPNDQTIFFGIIQTPPKSTMSGIVYQILIHLYLLRVGNISQPLPTPTIPSQTIDCQSIYGP